MKDIRIPENTIINPISKEHLFKGNKKNCLLLIHGFTGHPADMEYLGKKIKDKLDLTVYIPRLPGHGTSKEDFRESRAHNWLKKVYDSYLKLKSEYQEVYLAGLSMGGLLAILTAARFRAKKLVLISAALYAKNLLLPLTPVLKYILPVVKQSFSSLSPNYPEENEEEKQHRINYYTYHYTAQIAELYKIMKLARKKLPMVQSDTLVLSSKNDNQVPFKAANKIMKDINSINKKSYIFDNSPHVINNGPEKEKCADIIISFLNK